MPTYSHIRKIIDVFCHILKMGIYRVLRFEFPASSSPIFEFPASENSATLIEPSSPLAENSATLTEPSFPLAENSANLNEPSFPHGLPRLKIKPAQGIIG